MHVIKTVPGQAIGKFPGSGSLGDINRRSKEHWHLYDPYKKALAALVYTSVLKRAWDIAARSSGSLFAFFRYSNCRVLSERAPRSGSAGAP